MGLAGERIGEFGTEVAESRIRIVESCPVKDCFLKKN